MEGTKRLKYEGEKAIVCKHGTFQPGWEDDVPEIVAIDLLTITGFKEVEEEKKKKGGK